MRPRFLDRKLNTLAKAERAAREFAEMVGEVVNATISRAPVTLVEIPANEPLWFVAHIDSAKLPIPIPLTNGHFLYLFHRLGLRREERYLTTLEYRYVYQSTVDDDSWIFRYEHEREPGPDYAYAKSHVHINAVPGTYAGAKPFPALHLPTGRRVTVELLARHLISEHAIDPISPNWERVVGSGEAHFRKIQRRRFATDD